MSERSGQLHAFENVANGIDEIAYFVGFAFCSNFPHHFDESKLFQGEASQLKEEFRLKFLNISRIMDCVGCDKCKLWGKVQVRFLLTIRFLGFSRVNEV